MDEGPDGPAPQPAKKQRSRRRTALGALGLLAGLFVLLQFVPYGRAHSNPATTAEARWDSPRTRALAMRACGDCHSAETTWPWYSSVAPASWLVQRDVESGRRTLNFSSWDGPQDAGAGDIIEQIQGGSMPPWYYTVLHRNAALSASERADLMRGLRATLAASPPIGGG